MALSLPQKELFHLPEGVIYLDGNSLGPMPKGAAERAAQVIHDEWGQAVPDTEPQRPTPPRG